MMKLIKEKKSAHPKMPANELKKHLRTAFLKHLRKVLRKKRLGIKISVCLC